MTNGKRALSRPQSQGRRVFLAAVNHFFVEAGMTFTEASTVLVLLVKGLGGSNFLAGLLPSLRFFGWLVPQFAVAGRLERKRRLIPSVRALEALRFVPFFLMAGLTYALGYERPELALALFFILYLITRFAAGSSAVARADIVGRLVPPEERSSVVAIRMFAGGMAGFLAGFVVQYILDTDAISFPRNYALLLFLSGLGFLLAVIVLSLIQETPRTPNGSEMGLRDQLCRARGLLRRDRQLSLLIGVRAAVTGLQVASPFYIIYATEQLRAPAAMAGFYISARTVSRVLSNLYWGKRCRRRGSLNVLRSGLVLGFLTPALVILFPLAQGMFWDDVVPGFAAWIFGLIFLTQGLADAALGTGRMSFLYEIAPEDEVPTYFGLSNTILGPFYFLPALAGVLLDRVGFIPIFGVAALMLLAGLVVSTRLEAGRGAVQSSLASRRR